MTDKFESAPDIVIHPKAPPALPPVAGPWKRIFAFVVDLLVLALPAEGLGFLFPNFLFTIGPFGQLLGLVFILPYFGIMNSVLCGGQTLGKKLFKIAVRGSDNQPIALWPSFLRAVLLIVPIHLLLCLTFWMKSMIAAAVVSSLVYGWMVSIVVLFLVNKQARQGTHDLLLHTYVVDLKGEKVEEFLETSKASRILAAACLIVVVVGYSGVTAFKTIRAQNSGLSPLFETLSSDPRFFTTRVSNTAYIDEKNNQENTLSIDLWYKGTTTPIVSQQINRDIAPLIFSSVSNIEDYDTIQVKISSRRYLGLYSYNITNYYTGTLEEWRQSAGE